VIARRFPIDWLLVSRKSQPLSPDINHHQM
jgi:hypothetical protein